MKVFADDKINVTEKWKFILGRTENIVGKGENAGYQHFLLFPLCFPEGFFFKVFKKQDYVLTTLRERSPFKNVATSISPIPKIFSNAPC